MKDTSSDEELELLREIDERLGKIEEILRKVSDNVNAILDWLKSKNTSVHAIAGLIVAGAAAIVSNQSLRDQVLQFFSSNPKIGTALVALAGIIVTYKNATANTANPMIKKEDQK